MQYITYNRKVQKLINDASYCRKVLNVKGQKRLGAMLAQLRAAANLEELRHVPGNLHELKGDRSGTWGWTVTGAKRLIVLSVEDPPPRKPDGGLDWSRIDEVILLDIVDYH